MVGISFVFHSPGGSLKSLESLENGLFWEDPFSKRPLFPNPILDQLIDFWGLFSGGARMASFGLRNDMNFLEIQNFGFWTMWRRRYTPLCRATGRSYTPVAAHSAVSNV